MSADDKSSTACKDGGLRRLEETSSAPSLVKYGAKGWRPTHRIYMKSEWNHYSYRKILGRN